MQTRLIIATLLLAIVLSGHTATRNPTTSYVGVGLEQFVWKEFDDNGDQIVKESGQRVVFSIYSNLERGSNLEYDFLADLYFGSVEYDGGTTGGSISVPVTNTTDYIGFRSEFMINNYFTSSANLADAPGGFGAQGGFGLDIWSRNLRNGLTSDLSTFVQGYTENYVVGYLKLGLVWRNRSSESPSKFKIGAIRPLFVDERIEDIELNPKPTTTIYASYMQGWNLDKKTSLLLDFYYEHTHYDKSDPVLIPGFIIWQPEIDKKVAGVKFMVNY